MSEPDSLQHPDAFRPEHYAVFNAEKMGKGPPSSSPSGSWSGSTASSRARSTSSTRTPGMDKVYQVLEGSGVFLLEDRELEMQPGTMLVAPEGVAHGIRNTGSERLVVLAILAPGPG